MFKSLKKVFALSLACAFAFTACNNNADEISFESADNTAAVRSVTAEIVGSSSTVKTVKLTSDLNPGYGYAVYFTGTFNEGNSWSTAVRGTYNNGWYVEVTASENFEWKALTGSYSCGETTSVNNLTWESGSNHSVDIGSMEENVVRIFATTTGYSPYMVYFTGNFPEAQNWSVAVKGLPYRHQTKDSSSWYYDVKNTDSFEWKAMTCVGYDLDDTLSTSDEHLTWFPGANKTEKDGLSIKDFWEQIFKFDGRLININEKTLTVTLSSWGGKPVSAEYDHEIFEIIKDGEVVYSDESDDYYYADCSYTFDPTDFSEYTISDTPVSVQGYKGIATTTTFVPGMVKVYGSTFTMGSDSDEFDNNAEHSVTVTKPFYIARTEVTNEQWLALFDQTPSYYAYQQACYGKYPVVSATWYMAIAYCNKRSLAEGLTPVYTVEGVDFSNLKLDDLRYLYDTTAWDNMSVNWDADGYRLPTEAEWELAARAGSACAYSGSDEITDVAVTMSTDNYHSVEVASKNANNYGIYDMSGNAEEWVWDWYEAATADAVTDPKGAATGTERVRRGGAFDRYQNSMFTVYFRNYVEPKGRSNASGFRVVRNAD